MKKDKTPPLLKLVRWIFPKLEVIAPFVAHRFFVKIFFTPLNYSVPQKEKVIEQQADKFSIQAAGKRIQCYSWGNGPVVLLVHGWAGRATQFRKFIVALRHAGFRVIGFDAPAHGNSQGIKTNILEVEEALRNIYAVMDEPVAVIAHSFGGAAVLFASMRGLSVKKLINIASPTIGDEIINTYLKAVRGSAKTREAFKAYMVKKYGKTFDEFTSLYFIKHIQQQIDLLLVHDKDDEEVTIQHPYELKKLYPPARLYITKGLGHTRILKDEEVISDCIAFIREGRPSLEIGQENQ